MLVNLNEVLLKAKKEKYAVGLFNTPNLEMARGVIGAAEAAKSPVVIGSAEVLFPAGPLEELSYFLRPMAEKAKVPVVLHLDHGLKKETCLRALELGFTSVMYDCSARPYEENVTELAEITAAAHAKGATVEAELGHVGDNEGADVLDDPSLYFTDPGQAEDYVKRTGVDALAIAVGTAHGAYKLPPKLDFERIKTIAGVIDVPLVLHGGSGLTDEDFKKAIECGISKVNIFTDINLAAADAVYEAYERGKGMTDLVPDQIEAVKKATLKKMKLFGSYGKAYENE